jgi:hypothetical protein
MVKCDWSELSVREDKNISLRAQVWLQMILQRQQILVEELDVLEQ